MFLVYYLNQVYLNFVHASDIYLLRALSTIFNPYEYFITLLMSQETYKSWKKTFQSEQLQTCT